MTCLLQWFVLFLFTVLARSEVLDWQMTLFALVVVNNWFEIVDGMVAVWQPCSDANLHIRCISGH